MVKQEFKMGKLLRQNWIIIFHILFYSLGFEQDIIKVGNIDLKLHKIWNLETKFFKVD